MARRRLAGLTTTPAAYLRARRPPTSPPQRRNSRRGVGIAHGSLSVANSPRAGRRCRRKAPGSRSPFLRWRTHHDTDHEHGADGGDLVPEQHCSRATSPGMAWLTRSRSMGQFDEHMPAKMLEVGALTDAEHTDVRSVRAAAPVRGTPTKVPPSLITSVPSSLEVGPHAAERPHDHDPTARLRRPDPLHGAVAADAQEDVRHHGVGPLPQGAVPGAASRSPVSRRPGVGQHADAARRPPSAGFPATAARRLDVERTSPRHLVGRPRFL